MASLENSQLLYIDLDINKNLITEWLSYNRDIEYLNEIKKLPADLKLNVDKIIIHNNDALLKYINAMVTKILRQKPNKLTEEADVWNMILDSLKNFGSYDQLKKNINQFDSILNRMLQSIENYYDQLIQVYNDYIRQKNMQSAQQQYEDLRDISQKLALNIQQLSEKFRMLNNPYDKTTAIKKQVEQNLKSGDFESILDDLEILKNLTGEQDTQDYKKLIKLIQDYYSETVDKITCQIGLNQNSDKIMEQQFLEQIQKVFLIKKTFNEYLGVRYIKSMNRKLFGRFELYFQIQEEQIKNLLKNKNYFDMELEFTKYKKLRYFIVQILPTDNLEENQVNQQQYQYGNPILESRIDLQNLTCLYQTEGHGDQQIETNFVERFQSFTHEIEEFINNEQFMEEKKDVQHAKKTLDNLDNTKQKCQVFVQQYIKCYERLVQYYIERIKQQILKTHSFIQKSQINQYKQCVKDILKQVQYLDPHIQQSDIEDQIQNTQNQIKTIRDNQINQLQKMINENKYDQVSIQLDKLKINDKDTFLSQINEIFIRAIQDILTAEQYIQQNDYQNLTELVLKINGVLKMQNHLGEEEEEAKQLESKYANLQIKMSQAISKFTELFHNKYVLSKEMIQEIDVIKFIATLRLINKLTQADKKKDSIIQYIQKIQLYLYEKIKDLYNSYMLNIDQLNFKGINSNLQDSQILTPMIRNIKLLDDKDIADSVIDKNLHKICLQCPLTEEIVSQVLEKVNLLIQGCYTFWQQQKYQNLAINLKTIKASFQISCTISQLSTSFDLLLKYITTQITDQTQDVLQKIKMGQFKGLNEKIKQIYQGEEALSGIQGLYQNSQKESVKTTALNYIQAKLKSQDFKNLQNFGQDIAEVKQIESDAPILKELVKQQLSQILRDFFKASGNEGMFKLTHYLESEGGPAGRELINTYREFKTVNIANINKKAIATIDFALENFKRKKKDEDIQLDKALLRQFYDQYKNIYDQIIEKYQNQLKNINEIITSVRSKLQYAQISIENWNDAAKNVANDLIARIFAYWTLLEIGDTLSQDLSKKLVFKTPNPTQVLSIMMLLGFDKKDRFYQGGLIKSTFDNQLIQILTGEGKSITLGVASTIFALLGLKVDVVCYSQYLSARDYESFKDIFKAFNVDENIYYGTINQIACKMINKEGDIDKLTKALLFGQPLLNDKETRHNSILLIDEVDVFFGRGFYGNTYNQATNFCTPEIKQILIDIWSKKTDIQDQLAQYIFSSNSYKKLIENYGSWKKLINQHIIKAIADVNNTNDPPYILQNGRIGYKEYDGITFTNFYGYRTMYAYFQECENGHVSQQQRDKHISFKINCGNVSYAEIPKIYKNILGVTGTLDSLHPEMKKVIRSYDIKKESFAPSLFGNSRLIFKQNNDVLLEDNEESWMMKIQRYTQEKINDKQSVLIFFETKKNLEKYLNSTFLIKEKDEYHVITEETEDKEHYIKQSTLSGTVTLLVRDFGRGTDFICLDDVVTKEEKGVVVIQTFLAEDQSEETQIKGRTARQGQPGQYFMILLVDDLVKNFQVNQAQLKSFRNGYTIYETLNRIRDEIKSKKLIQQNQSIYSAKNRHNLTIEYMNALLKKDMHAADLLMKLN